MDAKELAELMLSWSDAQTEANTLRAKIEAAVLEIGKTQTVGNVKAQFRSGRKSYNYETAAANHPMVSNATVALFTTRPAPRIDWLGICKHAGIDDIPFTVGEPSVSVSLTE